MDASGMDMKVASITWFQEIEYRVLDGENQEKPGTGNHEVLHRLAENGWTYHRHLGMRTETGSQGENPGYTVPLALNHIFLEDHHQEV